MYKICLDFVSLHELPVLDALQRRGVFALYSPQGNAPLLVTQGDLIEQLADPAHRKNGGVTGYFATVEGNRAHAARDAKIAAGILNHITTQLGRPAVRRREQGGVDALRSVVPKQRSLQLVVTGRDPLKRPNSSRALRTARVAEIDGRGLARREGEWLRHGWR